MRFVAGEVCRFAAFSALLLLAACTDEDATAIPDEALIRLVVSPKNGSLAAVGDTLVLKANTLDLRGSQIGPVSQLGTPEWRSLNPSVAAVDREGVVRAYANGSAAIVVTAGGKVDTATVMVQQVLADVAVTPTESYIDALGDTTRLQASATDRNGYPIVGLPVYWQSVDPTIGSVDATGLVIARKQGTLRVQARINSLIGDAQVQIDQVVTAVVLAPPQSSTVPVGTLVALTAKPVDAMGARVDHATISWASSNPAVASVSATGVITTLAPGTTTITASSGSRSSGTQLVVNAPAGGPAPVASVAVSPTSSNLPVGASLQFAATMRDVQGFSLAGRAVSWTSSDPAIASISANGMLTGLADGSTTISATSEGKSGTAQITVKANTPPPPVGSVTLDPASAIIVVDGGLRLAATVRDINGNLMAGQSITWSSSAVGIASVNTQGRVSGISAGSAVIVATSGGKTGSAAITVIDTPPPESQVGSVVVAPGTVSVARGETTLLIATVKDTNGAVMAEQPVTWSSATPGVATVAPDGVVTGVAAGSATITASAGGKSGSAVVTVSDEPPPPPPVGSVIVTPLAASVEAGSSITFSTIVKDTSGNVMTGQPVTWSSSAPAIATVSSSGLVTGVAVGTATITAASAGKTGSAVLTVTSLAAPPLASITITPATANVAAGNIVQLTATARDASGAPIAGYSFNWSSSNPGVATVSTTGAVRGVAAGSVTITAAAAGKSAQAVVNVSPPVSVPGGLVFQDNFDLGKYTTGQTGGWWLGGGSGNVHVSAGGEGGSPFALSLIHRGKAANLMSSAEQRFRLAQGAPEIWIEYDFLVPNNFFHRMSTQNNNKFLALWEENYTGVAADGVTPTPLLIFEFRPMNDAPSRAGEVGASYLYLHGDDRTGKMNGSIGNKWLSAFGSWNRGKWLKIRVHVKMATSDTANDGVVELWADGNLMISTYNFALHSSASGHYIRNGYLLGWSNSGYDVDTEFKVDNMKVFTANPGW